MTLDGKEQELNIYGTFYNDSKRMDALTYKHTKTNKKFAWIRTEHFGTFIDRCYSYLIKNK